MSRLRLYSAYIFAVAAVVVLMVLEPRVSDAVMIVLICAAGIAHVWLTRRAVRVIVIAERTIAVRSTVDFLREIDRHLPVTKHTPSE